MKVLVHYQPNDISDNFEGARLRKTVKSALEMLSIPYTDALVDEFDIAHFLYPVDESVISELNERHIPVVVSALYCEDDPSASYIEFKNKDGVKQYTVKNKFIKFLDKANLVLVPSESAKQFLINEGVSSRIEVCPAGVNFSRFDFSRDDEKEIFYRYLSCDRNKKVAIAIGDSSGEIDGLSVLLTAAKLCEDVNFYYITKSEHGYRMDRAVKRQIKKLPRNLRVVNMIPNDVYRSALLNADIYIHPGYKPAGIVSLLEAMAAKCQVIIRSQQLLEEVTIDQETAYVASYSETLSGIIKDYFDGKLKPTIDKAYKFAATNDIKKAGKQLLAYYKELLNLRR